MNDDLISRQAVIDLISKFILEIHTEGGRDLNAHTNDVLRQILRNVKSDRVLPSVNPQEPKTGHWILGGYDEYYYICDRCKFVASEYYAKPKFHYCPNCGARMVEPQESEGEDDKRTER